MRHYDFSLSPNISEGEFGIIPIVKSSGLAAHVGLTLKVRITPDDDRATMDEAVDLLAIAMEQVGGPIPGRTWQIDGCEVSSWELDQALQRIVVPTPPPMKVSPPGSGIKGIVADMLNEVRA